MLDRDRAREQARALDAELAKPARTAGRSTGSRSASKTSSTSPDCPRPAVRSAGRARSLPTDAEVVANLRDAGAVIMGKTVTTPYAWIDPPVTRNPWNLERTPGGSSSGSAAAVACGMCLGAIGTQTGGSITRPASFCGVAGMKPCRTTSGLVIGRGIKPLARSLDHVGPIARTVADVSVLFEKMMGSDLVDFKHEAVRPIPRFGRLRGFFDRRADPAILPVIAEACQFLDSHGAEIVEMDDPVDFEKILKNHRTVMAAEAADVHSDDLDEFPDDYPPRIRDLVVEGRGLRAVEYLQALPRKYRTAWQMRAAFDKMDRQFWITPATIGTAPDVSTTGDPAFNSPWSYTGLPTVSFPIGLAPDGLPVAVQIVGWPFTGDEPLLRAAEWCEQAIRSSRQ